VHMSWNGAAGVAAWRILAGDGRGSLVPRATIPSAGFESSVTLPQKYNLIAVRALDAAGRTLGASPTVNVVSFAASLKGAGLSG